MLEIARTLAPLVVLCGIAVFRMKAKYERGMLGKKQSKRAQSVVDRIVLGSAFSLLSGYFVYEIYSIT